MICKDIERLIYFFAKIPGFGSKSARRAVLHLLKNQETSLRPMQNALDLAARSVIECSECGNLDISSPCGICQDSSRISDKICVVENVADLWAIERGEIFKGKYHILGGVLSAINGVEPEDLSIAQLIDRVDENIKEVILATNATMEGQTTANYVIAMLKNKNIEITKLAYGIPIGGELDYLDEGTLSEAFNSRKSFV